LTFLSTKNCRVILFAAPAEETRGGSLVNCGQKRHPANREGRFRARGWGGLWLGPNQAFKVQITDHPRPRRSHETHSILSAPDVLWGKYCPTTRGRIPELKPKSVNEGDWDESNRLRTRQGHGENTRLEAEPNERKVRKRPNTECDPYRGVSPRKKKETNPQRNTLKSKRTGPQALTPGLV